jgi:tRNA-2-methylthio-N6-dimethylallyladenosine synthase
MARKYAIQTFGCQMNVHDSERMAGLLEQAGYEATDDPDEADLVILNTCSVRERAEDKLYSRLGEIRHAQAIGRPRRSPSPAVWLSRKARACSNARRSSTS